MRERILTDLPCGIIHENVERAKRLQHLRDGALAEYGAPDVSGNRQGFSTGIGDMLQRFVGVTLFFLQMNDGDFGTFPGKEHGHRSTDPGVTTRDEGHLSLQLLSCTVVCTFEPRTRGHVGFDAGAFLMLWREWGFGFTGHACSCFEVYHRV